MLNASEQEERLYLAGVIDKLQTALRRIHDRVLMQAAELQEQKRYLYENKAGMDHVEKVSVRQSIETIALIGESGIAKKKRIVRLLDTPYFGRIDFKAHDEAEEIPIYIGMYAYFDEADRMQLIYDWRAPVASMYYYELGPAAFDAPSGTISGEVLLKRQYRIRKGRMEYLLDNASHIFDEVLQHELRKASDDKMRHIVATIQKDQNAIIRNEHARVLIIQGVAGSGKTSIALHRIAFLLYRFKESIRSSDILIISPNKVFADYISNVLPELGEERIPEQGIEELAGVLLKEKYRFQSFSEQVAILIDKPDPGYIERIQYKATTDFIKSLDAFILHIENTWLNATELSLRKRIIPAWFISERFQAYDRVPLLERFALIVRDIDENVKIYYKYKISTAERNNIRKEVTGMFKSTAMREIYKEFFNWIEKPHLFKLASHSRLEYADVFPLIYLTIRLHGIDIFDRVKHLVVDEMQDYTPVQYAVLSKVFPCRKTILGDAAQSVNPYSASKPEDIQKLFPEGEVVKLHKSYRSTYEITQFAQQIMYNSDLVPIERHGALPMVERLADSREEVHAIRRYISAFVTSGFHSLGIICKSAADVRTLQEQISESEVPVFVLTDESMTFTQGVILTTAHMSKGLEFDQVIVPFATEKNYHSEVDRRMLYIACTRAMHVLSVTHTGERTHFIGRV